MSKMAVLKDRRGKGGLKILSYVSIYIYVPLRNDWSKVTYSQVHGSVFKGLLFQSFLWIASTRLGQLIQFWQDPKCRRSNGGIFSLFHMDR